MRSLKAALAATLVLLAAPAYGEAPPRPRALPSADAACVSRCQHTMTRAGQRVLPNVAADCPFMCEQLAVRDLMRTWAPIEEDRAQRKVPHRCGQGYVFPVVEDTQCPPPVLANTEPWGVWQREVHGRVYGRGSKLGPVCRRHVQVWSDWPECGGTPLQTDLWNPRYW